MKYVDVHKVEANRLPYETWLEIIAGIRANPEKTADSGVAKFGFTHPLIPEYPRCVRLDVIDLSPGIHRITYKGGRVHFGGMNYNKKPPERKFRGYGEPNWRASYAGLSPIYDYAANSDSKAGYFRASSEHWMQDGDFKFRGGTVVISIGLENSSVSDCIYLCSDIETL